MRPAFSSEEIIAIAFLLVCGASSALTFAVSRLRWPRSPHRRMRRLSEMSDAVHAMADWFERPEARNRPQSRRRRRNGTSVVGVASRKGDT
jgi:hypothetical protein